MAKIPGLSCRLFILLLHPHTVQYQVLPNSHAIRVDSGIVGPAATTRGSDCTKRAWGNQPPLRKSLTDVSSGAQSRRVGTAVRGLHFEGPPHFANPAALELLLC